MIIGRGGENISAMQSVSNCKIEVDRGAADKGKFTNENLSGCHSKFFSWESNEK